MEALLIYPAHFPCMGELLTVIYSKLLIINLNYEVKYGLILYKADSSYTDSIPNALFSFVNQQVRFYRHCNKPLCYLIFLFHRSSSFLFSCIFFFALFCLLCVCLACSLSVSLYLPFIFFFFSNSL